MTSAKAAETVRISTLPDGSELNSDSANSFISADGQFVTFFSFATDLVPRVSPFVGSETYVHERRTGLTERVGVASDGTEANAFNGESSLSADGRFVVFTTTADNLVPDDFNEVEDVFLRDRNTGITERVSVSSAGVEGNDQSSFAFGRGSTINVISADGRYIVFESTADNLIDNDTNNRSDIFVRDRVAGTTRRVSVAADGSDANGGSFRPTISADGQTVLFLSDADNIDASDSTEFFDFYVVDQQTLLSEKVSVSSFGDQANDESIRGSISGDGRFVVFNSRATNLVDNDNNSEGDVFLKDLETGTTTLVSVASDGTQANDSSSRAHISVDGRYIVFASDADNLSPNDFDAFDDIFRHDRVTGRTEQVSVSATSMETSSSAFEPAVSADGRYVTFNSSADEFIAGDSAGEFDVFVRDMGTECNVTDASNQFTLPNGVFELLALPCELPEGTTINELFGDDITGGYRELGSTTGSWVVFIYDPLNNAYINPGSSGSLSTGQGFWIIQITGNDVVLDLPDGSKGVSSNYAARSACTGELGCQNIALAGTQRPINPTTNQPEATLVNLIGNPFNGETAIDFDDLRITTSMDTCSVDNNGCTLDEATLPADGGANVLGNLLFIYDSDFMNPDGSVGSYVRLSSGSQLSSWQGYWAFELPDAEGNNPVLHFPDNR